MQNNLVSEEKRNLTRLKKFTGEKKDEYFIMKLQFIFLMLVQPQLSLSLPSFNNLFRNDEPNRDELIGDDIIYPTDDNENTKRGAAYKYRKWPKVGGAVRIPYTIEGSHDYTANIIKSIAYFNNHLKCGGLVPRTNEKDYVQFSKGAHCQSKIGRAGGMQKIEIGGYEAGWYYFASRTNCNSVGTIVHEIMHAVGFFHEQNRPDRDDYVKIHFENVKDKLKSNFDKVPQWYQNLFTAYDYRSIMHYERNFFTKNGKDTIVPIGYSGPLGNKELSPIDIDEVNKYFGCYGPTTNIDKTGMEKCAKQKKDCYSSYYWRCLVSITCPCKSRYTSCCKTIYKCDTKTGIDKLACEKGKALCLIEV